MGNYGNINESGLKRAKEVASYLAVLPHFPSDVVAMLELVDETLAGVVEKEATNATQCLGSQELDLRLRLIGVDETRRVDLDFLEVDRARADRQRHLLSVTSAVFAVGG